MKYFFISKTVNGDSKDCVEERIKALIASEDKQHPLSDQKIVRINEKRGNCCGKKNDRKIQGADGHLAGSKEKSLLGGRGKWFFSCPCWLFYKFNSECAFSYSSSLMKFWMMESVNILCNLLD